jgi:hypothetical protein
LVQLQRTRLSWVSATLMSRRSPQLRSDSATSVSCCEAFKRPSVRVVPVAGEGQASRTNQQSTGSVTAGRASRLLRSCQAERHQPVEPVPVPVRIPDDDCRSSKPSGVINRYRADWWLRAVWGTPLDPRNFHRKATKTDGFVLPLGATTTRDGDRPAQLFRRAVRRLCIRR